MSRANEFVITATQSMHDYALAVAERLRKVPAFQHIAEGIDGVDVLEPVRFKDGEMEVAVGRSLRGKDAVLFTSCARNQAGLRVEEAKIELYHSVDALKRAQAARILVFEPFVSCSRSDRAVRRSSVGLWVHFKTLNTLGANHLITYQLHSDKSKAMIDPTVSMIEDVPAQTLLKKYLCDTYIHDRETLEKTVRPRWAFCSVDAGGEKLARRFANAFGAPLVVAHKQRDYSKANTVESVNILSSVPIEGKTLWVVDDMIDTAGSVESLIRALAPFKPAEVNIIAVHAPFSPPAGERLKRLTAEGLLNRVVVTDTVHCPPSLSETLPNLKIVPSTKLSAKIIATLLTNSSISGMLAPFNAEAYLNTPSLFSLDAP